MVYVQVGRHRNNNNQSKTMVSGITPDEFSSLKNIESPIQGQIDELWKEFEVITEDLNFKIKSLSDELIFACDRIKSGELPIYNINDKTYALVNKSMIVEKVIIWNEESTYTPDLKFFLVESDNAKAGMIFYNRKFFKNNIFNRIYIFIRNKLGKK